GEPEAECSVRPAGHGAEVDDDAVARGLGLVVFRERGPSEEGSAVDGVDVERAGVAAAKRGLRAILRLAVVSHVEPVAVQGAIDAGEVEAEAGDCTAARARICLVQYADLIADRLVRNLAVLEARTV